MLPDTYGERAVPHCYSGLYPMYTHMMKQRRKVFGRAETGRQTQDDLARTLCGCIEIN